jgi:hypothetical protein
MARSRVTSLMASIRRTLPARFFLLLAAAEDDAGFHGRVVEEVGAEAEDALDEVGLDQLAA